MDLKAHRNRAFQNLASTRGVGAEEEDIGVMLEISFVNYVMLYISSSWKCYHNNTVISLQL